MLAALPALLVVLLAAPAGARDQATATAGAAIVLRDQPGDVAPAPAPRAAAPGRGPAEVGGDPVPALVAALRTESPYDAGAIIATDPRFARLTSDERARLLDGLREGPRWWAPLLNLYPGFGAGSLASRDPRGVWLAALDLTASGLFLAGVAAGFEEGGSGHQGRALVGAAGLIFLGSRAAGLVLPFTFSGRHRLEAERALREAPPPVTVAPTVMRIVAPPGTPPQSHAAVGLSLHF